MATPSLMNLIGACYYGGFGITLLISPETFYGPTGFLPYMRTTTTGAVTTFFGRSFGAMMVGLASGYFFDAGSTTLSKMFAVAAAALTPVMISNSMDDANFISWMWMAQLAAHLPLLLMWFSAGFGGSDKSKSA